MFKSKALREKEGIGGGGGKENDHKNVEIGCCWQIFCGRHRSALGTPSHPVLRRKTEDRQTHSLTLEAIKRIITLMRSEQRQRKTERH